ncbi:MAG: enoyl-CoA hydratase/isomerase family protein [Rhodospirillaceae bacterium]|jgi:enoyl-CoA hydratase/carnithine racemase
MTKEPDLLTEVQGHTGLITLNRPKALNALSISMLQGFQACLGEWAHDQQIHQVIIRGSDKAFCAGGDIRSIYDAHQRGDQAFIQELFRLEYSVNYRIATFPKPYIALMDGFVFGGGCGVSVHGSHRIVTEKTILAMPETCIGYFPDIGASYFLSKTPGLTGLYLGLTGRRITTADILYAKLADACVPATALNTICTEIISGKSIDDVIHSYRLDIGPSELETHQAEIDQCFAADTLKGVIECLNSSSSPWSAETLNLLNQNAPFSLKLTYKLLKNNELTPRESLILDYRIARHLIERPDFYEGVRAVLIDKDNRPKWDPADLNQVSDDAVAACFKPINNDDLDLPK